MTRAKLKRRLLTPNLPSTWLRIAALPGLAFGVGLVRSVWVYRTVSHSSECFVLSSIGVGLLVAIVHRQFCKAGHAADGCCHWHLRRSLPPTGTLVDWSTDASCGNFIGVAPCFDTLDKPPTNLHLLLRLAYQQNGICQQE